MNTSFGEALVNRYAVLVLAVLGVGHSVVATAQPGGGGVKAGVVSSTIPKINEELADGTAEARTGLTVGVFFTHSFSPAIGIQPEVLFTQKGTKYALPEFVDLAEIEFKLDYLEIPILLRANLGTGSTRGYLLAGPSFNFNVRSRAVSKTPADTTSEEDISDEIAKFELALTLAGGVELGSLVLEGRFSKGLTNLVTDVLEDDIKHRTFSVLVGLRF